MHVTTRLLKAILWALTDGAKREKHCIKVRTARTAVDEGVAASKANVAQAKKCKAAAERASEVAISSQASTQNLMISKLFASQAFLKYAILACTHTHANMFHGFRRIRYYLHAPL